MSGPAAPLSPARRVHRVAHRIGAVVAIPAFVATVAFLALAAYMWAKGPVFATGFSDLTFYSSQPTLKGDLIVFSDGSSETLLSALMEENKSRIWRYNSDLEGNLVYAGAFGIGGVIAYIFFRSLGWIIAGAFRD